MLDGFNWSLGSAIPPNPKKGGLFCHTAVHACPFVLTVEHAVTAPNHKSFDHSVREPESRSDVVRIGVQQAARHAAVARKNQLSEQGVLGLEDEVGHPVVEFDERLSQFVTDSKVQR